jgi:hypothetical protein
MRLPTQPEQVRRPSTAQITPIRRDVKLTAKIVSKEKSGRMIGIAVTGR